MCLKSLRLLKLASLIMLTKVDVWDYDFPSPSPSLPPSLPPFVPYSVSVESG